MMRHHNQTVRTFFHSLLVAVVVAAGLLVFRRFTWGAGFAIGSALSLFSLLSLRLAIPNLFYKGAPKYSSGLLQLLLLMKLPIYAIGLYFATRMGSAAAFAAFLGCCLVPGIISIGTIAKAFIESNRTLKSLHAVHAPVTLAPEVEDLNRRVAVIKAGAQEPAALPIQAPAIR